MRHFTSTALLCGAAILGASAQSVVVVDKNGVQHRFKADDVKEITFENFQSQDDAVNIDIKSVSVNPYGTTNIQLVLAGDNGDNLDLDLTQPSTLWLSAGTYEVDGSGEYTIDAGWSSAKIDGKSMKMKSGSLDVKLDGDVYTFTADFVVGDDVKVKGTYTGKLPNFGPVANYSLTDVKYVEVNNPVSNGFYYRFNDDNWKLELRIDLFSEGDAPKPGVYTFSESTDNGCAGSYVDLYSPYNSNTKFKEGTVTVEESGENTIISINGVLENGLTMTASYTGKLPARPAAAKDVEVNVKSVYVNPWNSKNIQLIFDCVDGTQITADIYQPSTLWLTAGKYVVDGSYAEYTIDPGFSSVIINGSKKDVNSGYINVDLDGDVYTFTIDLMVDGNTTVKGTYSSKINAYGPSLDYTLTGVYYVNVNNAVPNGFYYRFNDENWKIELRIDLFSEGDAPKAGTYTFSDSTENGCASSDLSLYAPYNTSSKFKEGTVVIEEDGENTIVKINGVLENGLPMTATYTGKLPARTAE